MERLFEDVRVVEALEFATKWDDSNADTNLAKIPTKQSTINMHKSNRLTKEQLKKHVDLVWANTTHANTPKYHAISEKNPTDDNTLNEARNRIKSKHVIMGKKIWNNLKSQFQIKIVTDNGKYKIGSEYIGPLLWDFIRRRVKPSTKIGAAKLKTYIKKKELRDFKNNVIKFNTWFKDTKTAITTQEGEGYNEYLRQLFRAY